MDQWNDVEKMIQQVTREYRGNYLPEIEETLEVLSIADYWKKRMHVERDALRLKLMERNDRIASLTAEKNDIQKKLEQIRHEMEFDHQSIRELVRSRDERDLIIAHKDQERAALEERFRLIQNEMLDAEKKRHEEEQEFLEKIQSLQDQQTSLIKTLALKDQTLLSTTREKNKAIKQYSQSLKQMKRNQTMQEKKSAQYRLHIEQLARNFSSQLRDILAIMSGKLQLASASYKMKPALQNVLNTMDEYIDQFKWAMDEFYLLAVSPEVRRTPCDMNGFVQGVMNVMKERAAAMGVSYAYIGASDLPEMMIDQELMTDAVMNILQNAFEAVAGKGSISVQTGFDRVNGRIFVKITDSGKNIGNAEMEKIFEPYFTTKQGHKGLGLSIARRIVELHGGDIGVECVASKGTIVTVYIGQQ